jgi:hypothetical protein
MVRRMDRVVLVVLRLAKKLFRGTLVCSGKLSFRRSEILYCMCRPYLSVAHVAEDDQQPSHRFMSSLGVEEGWSIVPYEVLP